MHNNIMAAGSRDRPPMLAIGRHVQWQSQFLRYIDTRPNGDAFKKCILEGPYQPTSITIPVVPATENSLAILKRTAVETILTMSPVNKAHYESEKEAIYLLLTGIGDEIYSTVDACETAHDMWIVIERLQQVNEIRVERIAKNANPLALIADPSSYPNPYYQASKSHKPYAPTSKKSSSTRSNASTKFKSKEIAKLITPPFELASEEDSDPKQAQRDKDMQKNLALIAKYFKKIYKPTNNNLRTFSNSRNKNVDNTPRYKNNNQTGQFGNQRTVTVAEARETVGSQVVQQTGIQCFNYKEFLILLRNAGSQKGLKTPCITKKRCYYAKKLRKVQYNAGYNVFANKRQHSEQPESTSNTCLVEKDDSNVIPDSLDICDNDI
ncbi:hypothetical protein Tco_1505010 [Tanacetum coccineum]